jgi:Raf kinase inhibitor-like YbhB/YbcL family protein
MEKPMKVIVGRVFLVMLPAALLSISGCSSREGTTAGSTGGGGKAVAISQIQAGATLTVDSPDIKDGQPIPDRFSDYAGGATPTLHWSAPPAGTKSIAVLVEDPDAPSPEPYVHWLVYDLPATATQVGATLPSDARTGTNSAGQAAYMGPRPPQGDPPHHYHFQVFALDTVPALTAGVDRNAFVGTATGHVLAKGELVVTYQKQ